MASGGEEKKRLGPAISSSPAALATARTSEKPYPPKTNAPDNGKGVPIRQKAIHPQAHLGFQRQKHDPIELAYAMMGHIGLPFHCDASRDILDAEWPLWCEQHLNTWNGVPGHSTRPLGVPSDLSAETAIDMFDRLLFFRTLPPVYLRWDTTLVPQESACGRCWDAADNASGQYLIEMDPLHTFACAEGRAVVLLGTLLHELVHVFFFHHGCRGGCTQAEGVVCSSRRYGPPDGRVGHGRAWQLLAFAVERCASHWLGFAGIDLGRAVSAAHHTWEHETQADPLENRLPAHTDDGFWKPRMSVRRLEAVKPPAAAVPEVTAGLSLDALLAVPPLIADRANNWWTRSRREAHPRRRQRAVGKPVTKPLTIRNDSEGFPPGARSP